MIENSANAGSGSPSDMTATGKRPGALLTDAQTEWVRRAVWVMSAMLVAGVALLIGRIIYLARQPGTQAPPASASLAAQPALMPEMRLVLPPGAEIRSMTAMGSRLAILHSAPGGDAITILDLATGQVASRVTLERGR